MTHDDENEQDNQKPWRKPWLCFWCIYVFAVVFYVFDPMDERPWRTADLVHLTVIVLWTVILDLRWNSFGYPAAKVFMAGTIILLFTSCVLLLMGFVGENYILVILLLFLSGANLRRVYVQQQEKEEEAEEADLADRILVGFFGVAIVIALVAITIVLGRT
jgi:small-conductance mechanosensitive channel